jgi:DNA-damage-inducible protein J
MSKTSSVFARVEPEIKEQAEQVLEQLGIPMSNAIGLFLNQVVLQRGIPFEIKLPFSKPLSAGSMSKSELTDELNRGIRDLENGRFSSAEDVADKFHRINGI